MEVNLMGNKGAIINKNLILSNLIDGKQYIVIDENGVNSIWFVKEKYIRILKGIIDGDITISDIKDDSIINQLIEIGIIVEEQKSRTVNGLKIDERQLARLEKLALQSRTPLNVKFELTYKCNYKCKYCYVEKSNSATLCYEEIEEILKTLKNNGTLFLYITGGEPFLHPDIFRILQLCSDLGFIITLQTNGSFIDDKTAVFLSKLKHLSVGISFHSCYEDDFDRFASSRGAFKNTINAFNNLKKHGVNFFAKYTVTNVNENDFDNIVDFFKTESIPFEIYTQILPDINDYKNTSIHQSNNGIIEKIYKGGYKTFKKSYCSALKTKLWISPNGEVYPCELIRKSMGSLKEEGFENIWFSKNAYEFLESPIFNEPDKCKDCKNKKFCNKCLAYLQYSNWNSGLKQFCDNSEIVCSLYS